MNKYMEFRIDVGVATGGLRGGEQNCLKGQVKSPQHAVALHEI